MPPVPPVRLPQAAAIVARWSADAIPPQGDGTPLAEWRDVVGGIAAKQTVAAARPRYRLGGAGGKPYVRFAGAQLLEAGPANVVATACQSGSNTALVVCRNVVATGFGFLFTASASTGYNLFANGTAAGLFAHGVQRVPHAAKDLTTLCYTAGIPDPSIGRVFVNASCINHAGLVRSAAGHSVGIGASPGQDGLGADAELYEVIVWSRPLTAAEVMQAEIWVRDKYGAPVPWAGAPFRVFHGDSLTAGQGSDLPLGNYPARVATLNGWRLGQWSNLGHTGISMSGMRAEAAVEIDPMVALCGASPVHLAAWEWFNQRGLDPAQAVAQTSGYFAERRAAGVARLVLATSTDAADRNEGGSQPRRAAYNAHFDANWRAVADRYAPIHTDPAIGVEGACPIAAPFGPYFVEDGIHLLDPGFAVLAQRIAPAMA